MRRAVPVLTVEDLRSAVDGMRRALDIEILMDHGWIVTLGSPGEPAQFSLMERDATAPLNPDLSLEVDDVDDAHERVRAAGMEIVHPLTDEEWGVRRFFYRDVDGHVVNVLSHRPTGGRTMRTDGAGS